MKKILFTAFLLALLPFNRPQIIENPEDFAWKSKVGSYMDQRIASMKKFLDSNSIVKFKYDLAFNNDGVEKFCNFRKWRFILLKN